MQIFLCLYFHIYFFANIFTFYSVQIDTVSLILYNKLINTAWLWGKSMKNDKIIGIFAEFERENLAERVSFGYEQKTREGYYTNTNGVYGYDYDLKNHKLVVNELEKKLVERVFDLYLEGYSYFKISKLFNEENIPTKRNGHWAPSTIKQILSNPLYIGQVRYGLSKNKKD